MPKDKKSSKKGELFYTKAGIGRKGVSSNGIKKNLNLIKHIANNTRRKKRSSD